MALSPACLDNRSIGNGSRGKVATGLPPAFVGQRNGAESSFAQFLEVAIGAMCAELRLGESYVRMENFL